MAPERRKLDAGLITQLRAALGDDGLVDDEAALGRYNASPWSGQTGGARIVLRPRSTTEVATCLRHCADARVGVVPHGGGTGFLGGQIAAAEGLQIVLALERMTAIRALDIASGTAIVEAGVSVAGLRRAAEEHGLTFPLTFGADASAQIGGALATNAGGMNALRHGSARDLCLGLEIVLASGEVLDLLKTVRKDNTGYDLKQLFIGAEGTLGIITAAALKLVPLPRAVACALVGLSDAEAAITLLTRLRDRSDQRVALFELITRQAIDLASEHVAGFRSPFPEPHPFWALLELEGFAAAELDAILEEVLGAAATEGLVADALVARSEAQRLGFRRMREALPEANGRAGWIVAHDICVPIAAVPGYLAGLRTALQRVAADCREIVFGHLGDGNLHVTIVPQHGATVRVDSSLVASLDEAILAPALAQGGSVSAEHGIGSDKVALLARSEPPAVLAVMRLLKQALDPLAIMNPGKVLTDREKLLS